MNVVCVYSLAVKKTGKLTSNTKLFSISPRPLDKFITRFVVNQMDKREGHPLG